jgi:hypothetical protein
VSKGQKLGLLTVKCGDQILARVNMVAEHGVERLQWADVLIMALRKLTMSAEV